MNVSAISVRYARALLQFALEKGFEDILYEDMLKLQHVIHEMPLLPVALRDPMMSCNERIGKLCEVVGGSSHFRHAATLIVRHKREDMLVFIAQSYVSQYFKAKKIVAVKLTTACPASETLKERVSVLMSDNGRMSLKMECVVDDSIIGGFVCETASTRLDASVASQLRSLKKKFVKQNSKLVR